MDKVEVEVDVSELEIVTAKYGESYYKAATDFAKSANQPTVCISLDAFAFMRLGDPLFIDKLLLDKKQLFGTLCILFTKSFPDDSLHASQLKLNIAIYLISLELYDYLAILIRQIDNFNYTYLNQKALTMHPYKDATGITPLLHECRIGSEVNINAILDSPWPQLLVSDSTGKFPIQYAVERKLVSVVKRMIEMDSNVIVESDKIGFSVLCYACEQHWLDVALAILVTGKAQLNQTYNSYCHKFYKHACTPLMFASAYGMPDVVLEILKQPECGIDIVDCHGNNVLDYTPHSMFEKTIPYIYLRLCINNADKYIRTMSYIQRTYGSINFYRIIDVLLHARRYDLIQQYSIMYIDDGTPLLKKISNKCFYSDKNSNTSLMLACKTENRRLATKILATKHVHPNFKNMRGQTALYLACYSDMTEVALQLLEHGHVDTITDDGHTILMVACQMSDSRVALRLIQMHWKGTNLHIGHQSINGYTALMFACIFGKEDIVIELLKTQHSNYRVKNIVGHDAYYYAANGGFTNICNAITKIDSSLV